MAQCDSGWHVGIEALKIIGLFEVLLATSCTQIQVAVMDSPLDSIDWSAILKGYTDGGCLRIVGLTKVISTGLTWWGMLLPFKKKEESLGNIEAHAKPIREFTQMVSSQLSNTGTDVMKIIPGAIIFSLLEFSHDNNPLHCEATGVDTILIQHHPIMLSYDLESMDCGVCDSCLAFENTNLISTWMRHSGYMCCRNCGSNCCSWHRTVKLSLSTTKSEDVLRRCSMVQENTQTEVVDSGKVIMRSVSTSLDNMSLTILLLLYQIEVLSAIILHCVHIWEWNFIMGTTGNAKHVMLPPTLMKIHNTRVKTKQFVKFVAIDIVDATGHMKKWNLGGVGYVLHTEGSLQFKQWDPGDDSRVLEKGSLDLGASYQDVIITLAV